MGFIIPSHFIIESYLTLWMLLLSTIRVSNSLDLDWARQNVQTVCKGYQQTKKVAASGKELNTEHLDTTFPG